MRDTTPVLLVGDIAASMQWYRDALGFEAQAVPEDAPHSFCILRRDDVTIFLQQLDAYRAPDLYEQREGGVWHVYIRTDDVLGLHEALRQRADVTIVTPPHRQPYGQTELEVQDPNGYVLVFAEPW